MTKMKDKRMVQDIGIQLGQYCLHKKLRKYMINHIGNAKRTPKRSNESKLVRTKICIREDQAKEKMVFSKESSRATFEMGNVELIELKKSWIQCPSCFHHVSEGTFLCSCGKVIKLDPDAINQIKEAFEILKEPFRSSPISTRDSKSAPNFYGSSITTRLMMYNGEQKATERFSGNLSLPITGRTHRFDTWITLYNSDQPQCDATAKRNKYAYFICAVLTNTDIHHLSLNRRDQGTGKRKRN